MTTLEGGGAFGVADAVPNQTPQLTSGTASLLNQVLVGLAQEAAEARGYAPGVAVVTVHCPVDVIAVALGRHRVTIWRAARRLKAAGLLDFRSHKTTAGGRTVNDGTLWAVALRPVEGGVRLKYEDMKHQGWRDLEGDVRRGRTAHAVMQQSKNTLENEVNLDLLRAWALSPIEDVKPPLNDCCAPSRRDLETVLDVQHAPQCERPQMVEAGAEALSAALRDQGGHKFYMALLWALLRAQDAGGVAPWYSVYLMAQRASVDASEGFARRPGALMVSRLKGAPWWSEVWHAPPLRVSSRRS